MTTARDLIKGSLRSIGVIASGEAPTPSEENDSLDALNMMLGSWSARGLNVFYTAPEEFSLVAAQASYTIGTGGNFNTARPVRIDGAFVRDSGGTDYPVQVIGPDEYRRISLKTTPGRPGKLWYNTTMPTGTIYVYPVPDAVETLHLDSQKVLTNISVVTAALTFPPEYEEALKYQLAFRLAPEFGRSVPAEVAALASAGMDTIMAVNCANKLEHIVLDLPQSLMNNSGGYNIYEG